MNNWNEYLSSRGARLAQDGSGHVPDFGQSLGVAELAPGFVAPVTDQGLIAVTGDDAAGFLHKQLTNDVEHLGLAEARLAGYCTPKGRLQATFLMWRSSESVFLQLARELQPALQKRLSMFVLRAKAKLADAGTGQVLLGIGGAAAEATLTPLFGALPPTPYSRIDHPLGILIRVADAFGSARYQWLTTPEAAQTAWPALAAALRPAGTDAWRLAEIHAGVPQVTLKTQEQFVPQMVNLELLGGVNFKKGCYPGQEIVARSQYLGKLKRRTALAAIDAPAQAGDEVFAVDDPDQPCGMIVNSAPNGSGGVDALVEMKLAALEQGDVRLGSASGVPLRLLSLPYALDALDL
ncbi:CAF17-like 4Fe-4S cluster assembly/insertion protein YgfZ [Massilia pseudoviolaceinigra]|uniref:CAF17-like 4Fe-4S cluster assembly/insertion protein YgfZ n=1 Tax=Massilia pseudoviolaceinigra TaxID=3057165 RepID=UPI002796686D|nr:folate-binding protein [Massilia sp. CCM 9206]MDQ1921597.1 folate-binding protein [Massilia sp. CCM 9206]